MNFWEFFRAARFALDHPWFLPESYWCAFGWPQDDRVLFDEKGRVIRYPMNFAVHRN